MFTGLVQLRLAIALWAKYACAVETDEKRFLAATSYARALLDTGGEPEETARLLRGVLDVRIRLLGPEHSMTLYSASNLAISLLPLGECAEAAVLLRTTLATQTRTLGADNEGTLHTARSLVNSLIQLFSFAEAEALCRDAREEATPPRPRPPRHARHVRQVGDLALTTRQARRGRGDPAQGPRLEDSSARRRASEHAGLSI